MSGHTASDQLKLMLDHVTLSVADMARARAFYEAALAPLGLRIIGEHTSQQTGTADFVGFGMGRKGVLWIASKGQQTPTTHICFRAFSRKEVRAFYEAGLAAGGADHGAPGIRESYHPAYYGAFVLDPEGHNIEAVCFKEETG